MAFDEAIFATDLVAAMPTEAGRPTRPRISARILWAIATGGPRRRRAPDTSRKASSMLTCSTTGVMEESTPMTAWE